MAKSREDELKEVKELIKKHYNSADGGMFFTRNTAGDSMKTIFKGEYFTLDVCRYWGYYELFGCTDEERKEVTKYYEDLEVNEEDKIMEFDKSRVYTSLNADELKVGSKVIVADSLGLLKTYVEEDYKPSILTKVEGEDCSSRFLVDDVDSYWCLAYLVEEPEEKKLKWTDLKIGDVLKNKRETTTAMVTQIDECVCDLHICAGMSWIPDGELEKWEKVDEDELALWKKVEE